MAGKEYQMAFAIGAKLQSQFGSAFKNAQNSVSGLQNRIETLNKTQGDIAAYQKQQKAAEQTRAKLEVLQKQYANLESEMSHGGEASVQLKNQMLQKQLQIDKTTASLEGQEKKLVTMGDALSKAGIDTNNLGQASQALGESLNNLKAEQEEVAAATGQAESAFLNTANAMTELAAAAGVQKILQTVGEAFKECAQEAIAFEDSMAGVKRTVGGSDSFLQQMGEEFKDLSERIPISTGELASIATTAGQLGIAQGDVREFTEVMAMLATTTDLTAESAATMLAQFANITGVNDYERLGSVVAQLGDATATTASKVVEMSQGMAAAASQAGMNPTDILAISAAVGSLGIEAQAGSTAMSTLIQTLYKATETGEKLSEFASVAGMTGEQFKKAWADDAVGAMNTFISGLNNVEQNGKSAIVILEELGITNVRQTKAILGLASAGDLLTNTISQAGAAWQSNTALGEKAGVMYETTQAKLTMLQNAFSNVKIAVGDAFTPIIGGAADAMTSLMGPIGDFLEANPGLVKGFGAATSVVGIATGALALYTAKVKLATIAQTAFNSVISGPQMKTLMIAVAGFAAVSGVIAGLVGANDEAKVSMQELSQEFEDLDDQIQKQQSIINRIDQYKALRKEIDQLSGSDDGKLLLEASVIKEGFTDEKDLKVIRELSGMIADKSGEITQILALYGADEISDSDLKRITDLAANVQTDDGTLTQELAILGAENISDEDLALIRSLSAEIETNEGELSEKLTLLGFENYSDFLKACALADEVSTESGTLTEKLSLLGFESYDDFVAACGLAEEVKTVDGTISIKVVESGLAKTKDDLIALQQEANTAKTNLDTAVQQLESMKERLDSLNVRKAYANTDWEKSSIQAEIDSLTESISAQEDTVIDLGQAYNSVNTELQIATVATAALEQKKAELASMEEEIIASSDGVIESISAETSEYEKQLDTLRQMAEAKRTALKAEIISTASKQAEAYAQSMKQAAEFSRVLNPALEMSATTQEYMGKSADEINAEYQRMLNTLDQMEEAEWFSPDNVDYTATIQQVSKLRSVFMGMSEDLSGYAGENIDWVDSFGYLGTNTEHWRMTVEDLAATVTDYEQYFADAEAEQQLFIMGLANGVRNGTIELEEMESIVRTVFPDTEEGAEMASKAINDVKAAIDEAEASAAAAEKVSAQVQAQLGPWISQMEELAKAYQTVYDEAYKSIDGQFGLFENVDQVIGKTGKDGQNAIMAMVEGMQSQKEYMDLYQQNLQAVKEMRLADGLVEQLSDGSAESAQILADIVASGTTHIDELNAAFAAVQQGKEDFASTVAEMQTDFTKKMATLQEDMTAAVAAMDMSSDAASAAAATMDAFALAAEGKLGAVKAAFARVAAAAKRELSFKIDGGYASGTTNAEPGFHMVGENGPELMYFNGGEKVLDAARTQSVMNALPFGSEPGAGGKIFTGDIIVKPEFVINGSASMEEAGALVDGATDRIREIVEQTIEDLDNDHRRSSYS